MTIELPDEQAAALKAKALAQGLTLEAWLRKLAGEETPSGQARRNAQVAAARILEIQKHVGLDPDGWTVRDYIDHGRRSKPRAVLKAPDWYREIENQVK